MVLQWCDRAHIDCPLALPYLPACLGKTFQDIAEETAQTRGRQRFEFGINSSKGRPCSLIYEHSVRTTENGAYTEHGQAGVTYTIVDGPSTGAKMRRSSRHEPCSKHCLTCSWVVTTGKNESQEQALQKAATASAESGLDEHAGVITGTGIQASQACNSEEQEEERRTACPTPRTSSQLAPSPLRACGPFCGDGT